jgi:glutamate-1-semialdehyde 2,1-aminomutase
MSLMGVGACLLGYADPVVNEAVIRRVRNGSASTLNNPEEVELAERLISIHPWAGGVRYTRTGGEAMAVAVRIARAHTGRDLLIFCGYHGWHDWYLAANRSADDPDSLREHLLPGLSPAGVPSQLAGTTFGFRYNEPQQLEELLRRHVGRVAAVVMEPTRSTEPSQDFLTTVRHLCTEAGAVLIFDEITSGWRLHFGGAHLKYAVSPDVAVFAKAIGNGHAMAAVIGTSAVMQAAQSSFISSTSWTEGVGPAAALATLDRLQEMNAPGHVFDIGNAFCAGFKRAAETRGILVRVGGPPALTTLQFAHPEPLALQTLYTIRMLDRGFLTGSAFYPSCAHTLAHVDAYLAAAGPVLDEIREAIEQGDVLNRIGGAVKHAGFARLT